MRERWQISVYRCSMGEKGESVQKHRDGTLAWEGEGGRMLEGWENTSKQPPAFCIQIQLK